MVNKVSFIILFTTFWICTGGPRDVSVRFIYKLFQEYWCPSSILISELKSIHIIYVYVHHQFTYDMHDIYNDDEKRNLLSKTILAGSPGENYKMEMTNETN